MTQLPRWPAIALALSAACGGGGGGGGGTAAGDACAFLAGPNCWKTAAATATACTNGLATGAFNGPTTTSCAYTDGTTVQFDPTATATASLHQDVPWDFTVLTSTAATCARFVETDRSMALTTAIGTFSESWASGTRVDVHCPDGTTFTWDMETALNTLSNCPALMPGWMTSSGGVESFGFLGMASADTTLWRCR